MIRSIEHPGVEISETNLSLVATNFQATTCLINGFANNGEDLTPTFVSDMVSYQTIFGKPTNDAERYSYYAVREALNTGGNVYFAKMSYDNLAREKYRAVGFDLDHTNISGSSAVSALFELPASASYVRKIEVDEISQRITQDNLDALRTANDFLDITPYSTKSFIIVDKSRAALEGDSENEGLVTIVLPAYNAIAWQLQGQFTPASAPYEGWAIMDGMLTPSGTEGVATDKHLWSGTDWVTQPDTRYTLDSISKDLSRNFPIFQYPYGKLDRRNANKLMVLVLKTWVDINNGSRLNYTLVERWFGSLGRNDKDSATGQSIFLGDIINAGSQYIEFYFNSTYDDYVLPTDHDNDGVSGVVYSMYQGLGSTYASSVTWPTTSFSKYETRKSIKTSDILENLDTIFANMSNIDETRLDLVVDAGISNITQYIYNHTPLDPDELNLYSPDTWSTSDVITSRFDVEYWQTVAQKYIDFCQQTRKDCMAIIDAPRAVSLEGNEKIIRSTRPTNTIDINILPKIKYINALNSSYGAGYTTWHKRVDTFSGNTYWEPGSIKALGRYCNTDLNFAFFEAPYGLTRGLLSEIVDISFSPYGKQEDQIYLNNWNYTKEYPLDGYVLWGQKTFQAEPSAFDRINVRRLFLKMERLSYDTARYFVGILNNYYNRSRLLSVLTPKFNEVQRLGGMYDFKLVCDETNNTEEVIDNNELKLAAMIKPSKVADFILVNFVALRTSGSFSEVII